MHVDRLDIAAFVVLGVSALAAYLYFTQTPSGPMPDSTLNDTNASLAQMTNDTAPSSSTVTALNQPCNAINDSNGQLACFASRVGADNLSACQDAVEPDACAGAVAFNASRLDACDIWIPPESCRYYYFISRLLKDPRALTQGDAIGSCNTLTDTMLRIYCLERHALEMKNDGICHAIGIDSYRDECMEWVHAS